MSSDSLQLLLDSVKNVGVLEAEEEGKAQGFTHGAAAAREEIYEGDHKLLVSVVSLLGLSNLTQKVVNIASVKKAMKLVDYF